MFHIANLDYYIRMLSPAVITFSLIWIATVVYRLVENRRTPESPRVTVPSLRRHKIRNEFIPRPGASPLLSRWGANEYRGWYIMISILLLVFMFRQFFINYRDHGSIFSIQGGNFLRRIFISEIYEFGTVILTIYFFSFFAFIIEKAKIASGKKSSLRRGILHIFAHLVMLGFLATVTWYLLERRYDVSISFRFAVSAHSFVQYMKMVSYLGTNQYLWKQSHLADRAKKFDTTGSSDGDNRSGLVKTLLGGKWLLPREYVTEEEVATIAYDKVIQMLANRGIDMRKEPNQDVARKMLQQLVKMDEYRQTIYPRNVNLFNFIEFSCMPVLVYEPKYPRTWEINYLEIIEKIFMIAGIIVFNWFLMEHFILPAVFKTISDHPVSTSSFIEAMMDMMVPLQLFVVLVFYLVFECILGANAELLRLADRETYSDWWNSTTFEEFSRKWNKPVHEFLLRHVHIEAQIWLGLSRGMATIVTFIYSIIAHEIVLLAMFGIFRPYLGFFSLFQIPLWYVMRSPLFQGKVLGNIVFWSCLTIAWPLMTVLFCHEYCMQDERNCKIY